MFNTQQQVKTNPSFFLASIALQATLVCMIAVPWTAQKLSTTILAPAVPLVFVKSPEPPPMVEKVSPVKTTQESTGPVYKRPVRVFQLPTGKAPLTPTIGDVDLPEMPPDTKFVFGDTNRVITGSGPTTVLNNIPDAPPAVTVKPAVPTTITVGGRVQEAKLLQRTNPVYPKLAKDARVSGVVSLAAVIAKDGTIAQLRVLSGHPLLVGEAVKAVQQWRYRPTELNGQPVEVQTTIDVRFLLSQQ